MDGKTKDLNLTKAITSRFNYEKYRGFVAFIDINFYVKIQRNKNIRNNTIVPKDKINC